MTGIHRMLDRVATCSIFGNLPTVSFGNLRTPSSLDQQYADVGIFGQTARDYRT